MTFSIAARCETTGMFGLAVSSSSPAVAARCAFVRSSVGAVASQNITDPGLGDRCLDLMENGLSAQAAIDEIAASTANIEYRQLTAVDQSGSTGVFLGKESLGTFAEASNSNVVCAGNLLHNDTIPRAMVSAFEQSTGQLAERLLLAMHAALDAGGEAGPVHSAGLLIAGTETWPIVNLRIDWSEAAQPVQQLDELWALYSPQMQDYIQRAKDPSLAPSYGVPGDQ